MDSRRYELALHEARRAVDRQASDVQSLRERTTSLVGIGALAAAFIGGLAIRDDARLSVWTYLAAAAFGLLIAIAVYTQWPRRLTFTHYADQLVTWADEGDAVADMERDLALHMNRHHAANARRLDWLIRAYVAALVLLVFELVFLIVDLRGR